jgi:pyruvate dehydrogenase E2 component (dihydrolipoamide acetyltransferase)
VVRRDVQQATHARATSHSEHSETVADGSVARGSAVAPSTQLFVDIAHTPMRRPIAARLTETSRDVPQFFVRGTARVDKLLRLRARINSVGALKVSLNDLVVTAAARAHELVPAMNVIWMPDAVRSFSGVDISVAVATDRGLVAPVLRGVDQMKLSAVSSASSELVDRARSGRLRQEDLEGGTLTVMNLGDYGTEDFAAMINPSQSAILAVGVARQQPVVVKGRLKVGTVMSMTVSVDHRAIDEAVAAQWMAALVSLLEEPVRILV